MELKAVIVQIFFRMAPIKTTYSGTLRHGYDVKARQTNYFFTQGRCKRSNLTNCGDVINFKVTYHSMQYHGHSNHNLIIVTLDDAQINYLTLNRNGANQTYKTLIKFSQIVLRNS